MNCDNCGKYNQDDSIFCGGCGKRIEKEKDGKDNSNYNYVYSSNNLVKNESGLFKALIAISLVIIVILASLIVWRIAYINKEQAGIENINDYSQSNYKIDLKEENDKKFDTNIEDNKGINSINTGPGTTNNNLVNNTYENKTINNTNTSTTNNININESKTEYNNNNINYQ